MWSAGWKHHRSMSCSNQRHRHPARSRKASRSCQLSWLLPKPPPSAVHQQDRWLHGAGDPPARRLVITMRQVADRGSGDAVQPRPEPPTRLCCLWRPRGLSNMSTARREPAARRRTGSRTGGVVDQPHHSAVCPMPRAPPAPPHPAVHRLPGAAGPCPHPGSACRRSG